jgi:hypothetical protein
MNCSISTTPDFDRALKSLAKRYASIKDDYAQLLKDLKNNPLMGTPLGHNMRKVRMAILSKGKGKSGGARVITHNIIFKTEQTHIILMYVYDKSDRANISDNELTELLKKMDSYE